MSLDDRKKVVRHHIDLSWNKGRLALAEQLHSRDFLYKSSFIGRPLSSPAFIEMVLDECIAEDYKVVTWSTLIGTIQKPALGYPPSDKILSISAMAFWTLNPANEIQEICTMFDMESFRSQLGLATQPFAAKALP